MLAAFSYLTHEAFYLVRGVWYTYALQRELRECDEKLTVTSYELRCLPVASSSCSDAEPTSRLVIKEYSFKGMKRAFRYDTTRATAPWASAAKRNASMVSGVRL